MMGLDFTLEPFHMENLDGIHMCACVGVGEKRVCVRMCVCAGEECVCECV